jgi:hypothetical protein
MFVKIFVPEITGVFETEKFYFTLRLFLNRMKYIIIFGLLIGGVFTCLGQDITANAEVSVESEPLTSILIDDPLLLVSSMKTARIVSKGEFEKINHSQIAYIQIITDPSSTFIYGDKAKNGVVLIVMKDTQLSDKYSTKKRRHR